MKRGFPYGIAVLTVVGTVSLFPSIHLIKTIAKDEQAKTELKKTAKTSFLYASLLSFGTYFATKNMAVSLLSSLVGYGMYKYFNNTLDKMPGGQKTLTGFTMNRLKNFPLN